MCRAIQRDVRPRSAEDEIASAWPHAPTARWSVRGKAQTYPVGASSKSTAISDSHAPLTKYPVAMESSERGNADDTHFLTMLVAPSAPISHCDVSRVEPARIDQPSAVGSNAVARRATCSAPTPIAAASNAASKSRRATIPSAAGPDPSGLSTTSARRPAGHERRGTDIDHRERCRLDERLNQLECSSSHSASAGLLARMTAINERNPCPRRRKTTGRPRTRRARSNHGDVVVSVQLRSSYVVSYRAARPDQRAT